MITFASLFLGLVFGVHTVAVTVSNDVTAVDVLLDDRLVGTIKGSPWSVPIDFGSELAPHELVAVAFDALYGEVGRATQWVNSPRPPVEAVLMVERDAEGRGTLARLNWGTLLGTEPSAVEASFDGRPLEVEDLRAIALPDHDPELLHVIRAELEFADAASASVELVFGGFFTDRSSAEMTAVPVVKSGGKLPAPEKMAGWFTSRGKDLRVVAWDKGPSEIVVVQSPTAGAGLARLRQERRQVTTIAQPVGSLGAEPTAGARRLWRVQFLSPRSRRQTGPTGSYDLFPHSQRFSGDDAPLLTLLSSVRSPVNAGRYRLADAVAVAGVTAATANRRRAVLLLLSADEQPDDSDATPAKVRGFLERLRVPLHVWVVGEEVGQPGGAWGETKAVSGRAGLEKAVRELERALDRQRIVWLDGTHLPQSISLSGAASDLRLAR